jgi:hypothetical protein
VKKAFPECCGADFDFGRETIIVGYFAQMGCFPFQENGSEDFGLEEDD